MPDFFNSFCNILHTFLSHNCKILELVRSIQHWLAGKSFSLTTKCVLFNFGLVNVYLRALRTHPTNKRIVIAQGFLVIGLSWKTVRWKCQNEIEHSIVQCYVLCASQKPSRFVRTQAISLLNYFWIKNAVYLVFHAAVVLGHTMCVYRSDCHHKSHEQWTNIQTESKTYISTEI